MKADWTGTEKFSQCWRWKYLSSGNDCGKNSACIERLEDPRKIVALPLKLVSGPGKSQEGRDWNAQPKNHGDHNKPLHHVRAEDFANLLSLTWIDQAGRHHGSTTTVITITGKTSIGVSYCALINKFCSRHVSTAIDDRPSALVLDVVNKAHYSVHVDSPQCHRLRGFGVVPMCMRWWAELADDREGCA